MTQTAVYERLRDTRKLPSPSGVALRVLQLASDKTVSVDEIADAVMVDPAISSRLLKLVNSSVTGLPRKVASVPRATAFLGVRTVAHLALGFSLVGNTRKGACAAFDYELFWSESLARAVACRFLADRLRCMAPDEAFTLGLVSQIGLLALASAYPDEYGDVVREIPAEDCARLAEVERSRFGIDHVTLAAKMMADWQMPGIFCRAVSAQLEPEARPRSFSSRDILVSDSLALANDIARVLSRHTLCEEHISAFTVKAHRLGIAPDVFHELLKSIKTEWREAGRIFNVETRNAPRPAKLPVQPRERDSTQCGNKDANPQRPVEEQISESKSDLPRVLAVDDDPFALQLLHKHLTTAGYDVLSATNGVDAMRIILSQGPQLVITDWKMPEMDGIEFCRTIRAQEGIPFAYVILVTAHASEDGIVEAFDAGVDDFLSKPFSVKELLARVRGGTRIIQLNDNLEKRKLEAHRSNAEMAIAHGELQDANEKLHRMATTDELTGLTNRREALERLRECWATANRHDRALSCIMLDIDHFKSCNDTHGHAIGDLVLKATAHVLRDTARTEERVCRVGGEEFLVLCPDTTEAMASVAAERFRAAVESNSIETDDGEITVTISLGVSERGAKTRTPDDLLGSADYALYAAKHRGRNRVCLASECDPKTESRKVIHEEADADSFLAEPEPLDPVRPARILVVDDDSDIRKFCKRVLEREGHEIIEAVDGYDALRRIDSEVPDVAIIDAVMPNMDGLECTRRLKRGRETRSMSIIIASACDESTDLIAGLEAGADEYLTKPLEPKELALRVRTMVRLRRDLTASNEVRGEQTRALSLLLDYSHRVMETELLDEVLESTVAVTAELTCSRRVSIMLPDETGRSLTIAKSIGIDNELAANVRVGIGTGISGSAFESGRDVIMNEPGAALENNSSYETPFFASAPLVSKVLGTGNHVVGVLNITNRHAHRPFSSLEFEYIDFIANIAAAGIDESLTRRARDQAHESLVIALATLAEHRDAATGRHLDRVSRYSTILAEDLRRTAKYRNVITDSFLENLELAVPLHDIGKVAVPDHILLKPGRLTQDEFTAMKTHAETGAKIIRSVINRSPGAQFLRMAEQITLGHHEWYNGKGYPAGVSGENIPLAARITAIADVYDALRTERPYKAAMPHEQARQIITAAEGTQFDPDIVQSFKNCEGDFMRLAAELGDKVSGVLQTTPPVPRPSERQVANTPS